MRFTHLCNIEWLVYNTFCNIMNSDGYYSLNLLENHPNIFIPSKANKYTESDLLARLWTPLFDLLLSAGNNLVRLKT